MPYPTLAWAEVHHPKLEAASFNRQGSWRVTEVLSASAWQALMESVDYWPMAIIFTRHLGVSPSRYPPSGVTGGRYPPPEGRMLYPVKALAARSVVSRTVLWGTQWGQLDSLWELVQPLLRGPAG